VFSVLLHEIEEKEEREKRKKEEREGKKEKEKKLGNFLKSENFHEEK
jgi:hypothetical protein